MAEPFTVGTPVTVTEELHGATWAHWDEQVVHDDTSPGGVLATLQTEGNPLTFPPHPFPHPWRHVESWAGTTVLKLRRMGEWYSVWKFFDSHGTFQHWYVNFETPYTRTDTGIGVNDLQLDIVLGGDGTWRWKDVQDLAPAVASGRMSVEELHVVLGAATEVAVQLDAGDHWWAPWRDWAPERGTIGA